ncbi:unnamed protein product [Somion occarium]|uniref:RNA helicase n=1 Tax=Somion occarium TaxID=3059160 RepID=A0ABP1CKR8_9APHY
MASFSRSLTCPPFVLPLAKHSLRPSLRHIGHASQSVVTEAPPSFESLGISKPVAKALQSTFPNVQIPTKSQRKFIPAVLSGFDVLLQNDTGTGKTFGLILALLSKPRQKMEFRRRKHLKGGSRPSTVLVITPHRELALQCMHWIQSLHGAINTTNSDVSTLAQLVVRGTGSSLKDHISQLHEHQPRLVIGTPNALLDVFQEDPSALPTWAISTVVVDEVDTVIEHLPPNARKYDILKFERMLKKHPTPTRQILNLIYPKYIREVQDTSDREDGSSEQRTQFIATSATLRSQFKFTLMRKSGWVTRRWKDVVDISGSSRADFASLRVESAGTIDSGLVQHSALVVSPDGTIKNIDGSKVAVVPALGPDEGQTDVPSIEDELSLLPMEEISEDVDDAESSPFNQEALEAIATIFALEVPQVALLVLPATAPVKWAIHDLRKLGINAHGLNILDEENVRTHLLRKGDKPADNPTMIVSTTVFTRGLDLPDLSHVFRLGVWDDMTPRTYVHIAGRVGRFGKEGKVVTVVESPYTFREGKKVHVRDEPSRLAQIYKKLKISPVKLEYFG